MPSAPNLFSFATSELSQDAFLCWLMSWASPEYQNVEHDIWETNIKSAAESFLRMLYRKTGNRLPKIKTLKVWRQEGKIDILCLINEKELIIIEDKVGTTEHDNQLERYKEYLKQKGYTKLLPIYLQTGDQNDYSEVEKAGFALVTRQEFLKVLQQFSPPNDIYRDYVKRLQEIEADFQSFRWRPLDEWTPAAWRGFYSHLKQELHEGEWSYVSNPAGGFWGFWWNYQGKSFCRQYLQLTEDKLCLKIRVGKGQRKKALANYWRDKFVWSEYLQVKKAHLRIGETMTVAHFDGEYRSKKEDGTLDLNTTVEFLKQFGAIFASECRSK